MINEFIEKIIVHAPEKIDGDRVQEVEIYLKFIGRFELPEPELTPEEIKRQEQLRRHRIKSRERYQKIKAGEHAVGQPFQLICKCCGEERAGNVASEHSLCSRLYILHYQQNDEVAYCHPISPPACENLPSAAFTQL